MRTLAVGGVRLVLGVGVVGVGVFERPEVSQRRRVMAGDDIPRQNRLDEERKDGEPGSHPAGSSPRSATAAESGSRSHRNRYNSSE